MVLSCLKARFAADLTAAQLVQNGSALPAVLTDTTFPTCTNNSLGRVRYNTGMRALQYCMNFGWLSVSPPILGTSPTNPINSCSDLLVMGNTAIFNFSNSFFFHSKASLTLYICVPLHPLTHLHRCGED